jgi:hypothetical protein
LASSNWTSAGKAEGSWAVAADTANGWQDGSIGSFGYVRTVLLFQVVGNRVVTVIEISTNVLPTNDGWGVPSECARADLLLAIVPTFLDGPVPDGK